MKPWQKLLAMISVFLVAYFMPLTSTRFTGAVVEALYMVQDYARLHVLTCLVPALFIAGAISNFISQNAVIRYFGASARKWLSYAVASVSGAVLAVCSCTVLPLFAGLYLRGAGIGPAVAFLYAGPAINILAIIMTARVLGWQIGVARAVGAVVFAIVIGLIMSVLFRKEEESRLNRIAVSEDESAGRTLTQNAIFLAVLVLILIFAAWSRPPLESGFFYIVFTQKWLVTAILFVILGVILLRWFRREELPGWMDSTWVFAQQILPLLFIGVMAAGFLMGRPGLDAGVIPAAYVEQFVGGNSLQANLTASVLGAFMYFATLTEIPILQALMGAGMGSGPALALLLAGPALSLPSMLVINSVLGPKKTGTYILLVVIMATLSGLLYGAIF
jgi:uncharacterized protein